MWGLKQPASDGKSSSGILFTFVHTSFHTVVGVDGVRVCVHFVAIDLALAPCLF